MTNSIINNSSENYSIFESFSTQQFVSPAVHDKVNSLGMKDDSVDNLIVQLEPKGIEQVTYHIDYSKQEPILISKKIEENSQPLSIPIMRLSGIPTYEWISWTENVREAIQIMEYPEANTMTLLKILIDPEYMKQLSNYKNPDTLLDGLLRLKYTPTLEPF